ncbi:LamG-like jellyroll fold domain-containing protein [Roseiconus lacunae]|uniref:FecR domain-containing protein n=1 Tax=Roseiconus lacunae TaxID=2605694 RepID=A0ABT7PN06_9BACT|nr:LamG-like jellyroll fold domain-containing protein [Roseiconus lacunae]MDM4017536.1 FecR domain-containing protein [Roseiconus lacunae]
MDKRFEKLIFQAIDQTISPADFQRLQDAIESDAEVRQAYLKSLTLCEQLGEIAQDTSVPDSTSIPTAIVTDATATDRRFDWRLLGLAATLLIAVSVGAYRLGRQDNRLRLGSRLTESLSEEMPPLSSAETQIAGHATLRRGVALKWPSGATRHREGDVLPNGLLAFEEGTAEIDFFCGATLIVEGPASFDIESDWSVAVTQGRLRANVPPAARGFVVRAADSEIIDLGTEFVLEVDSQNVRVDVIDGEVELRGGAHDGQHLLTGEGVSLKGDAAAMPSPASISTVSDLQQQRRIADERSFERWKTFANQLSLDRRLIAYFPIASGLQDGLQSGLLGRVVPDVAASGQQSNGRIVGPVTSADGRFGDGSYGLEFDRTGARVRTRIDGTFRAFTFACWAKIDSLKHRYNALFMSDGYENGELHWQIRDDGRLMFSVMVDDTQKTQHFSPQDNKMVTQAGLHRVYYSDTFWDLSQSGQWFHLAAVYDPANRKVIQYVNGTPIASETIAEKFYVDELHIGAAEIGNWGQPFRKTPWFAVRNFNGAIDEMAIFDAALSGEELRQIYESGKPVGY